MQWSCQSRGVASASRLPGKTALVLPLFSDPGAAERWTRSADSRTSATLDLVYGLCTRWPALRSLSAQLAQRVRSGWRARAQAWIGRAWRRDPSQRLGQPPTRTCGRCSVEGSEAIALRTCASASSLAAAENIGEAPPPSSPEARTLILRTRRRREPGPGSGPRGVCRGVIVDGASAGGVETPSDHESEAATRPLFPDYACLSMRAQTR